ncbi:MAG: hypothetical protein AAF810_08620 [Cyanobacteria bacterium P01_D01_bin.36]
MQKPNRPLLKPNPFISLRDPETGKWRVIFKFPTDKRVSPPTEKSESAA